MAPSTDYSETDVCNIMRLKWLSFMWRKLVGSSEKKLPRYVPPGHLAVTVGEAGRRFVIKADYLNQPVFRHLLDKVYEEHSPNKDGPLAIPCDECLFRDIIHSLDVHIFMVPCDKSVLDWCKQLQRLGATVEADAKSL
ncbi:hypothetical protein Gotri_011605 [Gossypium trilobum]|uniref:Uncharacterized protein n=1 Tax=Gossypium trilobum TaxID=34281 RepID=A0A7J9EUC3_9ROSI|nr:hypothetical protein [Gossypium trilobum]